MIRRVLDGFRFLGDLTAEEKVVAADTGIKKRKEAQSLIASLPV
jgi:hypothetical protein